jgi:hypothetical protein
MAFAQDSSNTVYSDTSRVDLADSNNSTLIDSTQLLKQQERAGKISGQLARNRNKLADLEKAYTEKTADKEKAIANANASAEENRKAAIELSNDASNRSKARRAQKLANRARRDTKSVQRAEINLKKIEKDIAKVKKQIENDEKELTAVQQQK